MEAMDFGDQLRRAATVAHGHPEVADAERDRFRVVLLDEYQDTSQAQVVLLQSLFGAGHPVTAVGDPCQSIYGWRGASAGTLDRFSRNFPKTSGAPADHRSLTVSWRNAPQILSVANRISDPLRGGGAPVLPLRAASTYAPRFVDPLVRCAYAETYLDEAAWVAERIDAAWRVFQERYDRRPTTAVLVRARAQIPTLERALRERGLPVEVVGLGGLLDTPEVRDVVCTLQVLADPTAGASLLRLLTGARWRVGPRDIVALYRRAAPARLGAPPPGRGRIGGRGTGPRRRASRRRRPRGGARRPGPRRRVLGRGISPPPAVPRRASRPAQSARPEPARPGRRRRPDDRARRRGGRIRRRGDLGRARPGAPGRHRRRRGPVRRGDRGRDALGVPGLPGRGRGGGAGPHAGRGRGGRRGGTDPDCARREGPRMGRRRGGGAVRGRVSGQAEGQ